jgi:hypothetical protein
MAKANILTKDGTKIVIEGTPEEVSSIVSVIKEKGQRRGPSKSTSDTKEKKGKSQKLSATDLILVLKDESFFDKPKALGDIKIALEEQGYYYPITTLSGVVLELVRKRELGRIKIDKKWGYVKR